MRELRTAGRAVKMEVEIYDKSKYEKDSKVVEMAHYSNVISWELVTGEDAIDIEVQIDELDDYNEYLVLYLEDGDTATFRNSRVDMFREY